MTTISTFAIFQYMCNKFETVKPFLKNGALDKRNDKCIGIFLGSETRSKTNIAIGGIDCTTVRMIPINIHIRWTDNAQECDDQSIVIYDELLSQIPNFEDSGRKFACIEMLDVCPISLGRDDRNICETMIRTNFYYYV